ncbi:hypothetical protein [Paractinoplanes rishiriensis]|uniref:Uncharacterized protein n=1 Tax=Paractinoplanes rishiriensis TaxID=1050105 RepID=A0A919K4S3_9ACTN|nr:hypothetical protein [Actinoplanes rishiriensis]GIE98950.1 hypothetical protein Ari01nite_64150 [Actinoplanes rishiriensis]
MDASRVPVLITAVDELARLLDGIDTGDVFSSFTCSELDGIATVLAIAGHQDTAAFVIAQHAMGDEFDATGEDDSGFDAHAAVAREQAAHEAVDHPEAFKRASYHVTRLLEAAL